MMMSYFCITFYSREVIKNYTVRECVKIKLILCRNVIISPTVDCCNILTMYHIMIMFVAKLSACETYVETNA